MIMNDFVMQIIKIKKWDWLLIIGLCLAPMTGLRLWKVGPAELLCFLWGIKYLVKREFWNSDILKFHIFFLLAVLAGTLMGMRIAPNELRFNDLMVWLYLAIISVLFYEGLYSNSLEYNEKLFFIIAQTSIVWNLFLYAYSIFISRSFLNSPLWYAGVRYSGGGINPHQVAVLLCGMVFAFMWKVLRSESLLKYSFYIAFALFLLFQTKSSTGIVAIFMGFFTSIYFKLSDWFPSQRTVARVLLIIALLIIGIIGYNFFYHRIMLWIASDPNGLGRLVIFSSIFVTLDKSLFLGLGPGIHALNGYIEYHNTYLEILAMTGLFGFIIFIIFTYRLFRKVAIADWRLLPIIVTLYAYGFAGFAMRRLIYWGLTVLVLVLAEQIISIKNRDKENIFIRSKSSI